MNEFKAPTDAVLDEQVSLIAERIKSERERLSMSQGDLATAARLPIPTVYQIEAGHEIPNALTLHCWALAGMDVRFVITGVTP